MTGLEETFPKVTCATTELSVNNHTSASSKNRRPIPTQVPWCKMDKLTTERLLRDGNLYCWDPNSQTPLKSVCRMTDQTRIQFR